MRQLNVTAKYHNKPSIYSLPGHMGSEQSAVPAPAVSALWGRITSPYT
ncbi:hypothetical protein cypCar_00018653 [Cyprinus carpio]|nr:hypothetical protein cypCar_00018653 [Cyprinus carpio]